MTPGDAAKALDGCQYGEEGNRDLFRAMKAAGLVAVYGASDDLVMLAGAVDDELGASDGSTYPFTRKGLLVNRCEDKDCPYFAELRESATPVKALFGREGVTWSYETAIPHTTFTVMEDGEIYCRGLVFALSDVP